MSHDIDKSNELEQVKINPNDMKCWYVCRNTDNCETCERGQQVKLLASNCGIEPYNWLDKFKNNHIDTASYRILQEYKQNIRQNVENAKSLYICSRNHNTGKTSWSVKMLYTYIDQIWIDNEKEARCFYLHVPSFVRKYAEFSSRKNKEYENTYEKILESNLVVFDGLTDKVLQPVDQKEFDIILDMRGNFSKANIITGLSRQPLINVVGKNVAERVKRYKKVELKGNILIRKEV